MNNDNTDNNIINDNNVNKPKKRERKPKIVLDACYFNFSNWKF